MSLSDMVTPSVHDESESSSTLTGTCFNSLPPLVQSRLLGKPFPMDLVVNTLVLKLLEEHWLDEAPGDITSPNLTGTGCICGVEVIIVQYKEKEYDLWVLGYDNFPNYVALSFDHYLRDPRYPKHYLNLKYPGVQYATAPSLELEADLKTWPCIEYVTPRDQIVQMISNLWEENIPYATELHRVLAAFAVPFDQTKGRLRLYGMHNLPEGRPGSQPFQPNFDMETSSSIADRLYQEIGVRMTLERTLAILGSP